MKFKPKVSIIRGPSLSKWEMQIYEPLTKWFDIKGIGSTKPINDVSGINFPIEKLFCPGQYITKLPKTLTLSFKLFGDTQYLWGFENAVKGVDIVHSVELSNFYTLQAVRAKKKDLVKAVTLTVYENNPYVFYEFP